MDTKSLQKALRIKDATISCQEQKIKDLEKKLYVSGCVNCGEEFRRKLKSELYAIKNELLVLSVSESKSNDSHDSPTNALLSELNKSDNEINVGICMNLIQNNSNLWRQRPFRNETTLLQYMAQHCNQETPSLRQLIKAIFDYEISFNVNLKNLTKSEFILFFTVAARAGLLAYVTKMIDFVKSQETANLQNQESRNSFMFDLKEWSKLNTNNSDQIESLTLKSLINGKNGFNETCLYCASCNDSKYEASEKIAYFLIDKFTPIIKIDIYSIMALGLTNYIKQYIDNLHRKFK